MSSDEPLTRESVSQLLERLRETLAELGGPSRAALATDGDGTLWTADIGEALFEAVRQQGLVGEAARDAMIDEADRHHVLLPSTKPDEILSALWDGYLAQTFPEERMCAVMTWCMAGTTLSDLELLAQRTLDGSFQLRARLIPESGEIVRWAADQSIPVWLVSASPRPVVECAARVVAEAYGVPAFHVIAMTPTIENGVVCASTTGVLPYGDGKLLALESELAAQGRSLLCALGDNVFDAPMLRAARIPIAIRPKPALTRIAPTVRGLVRASTRPPAIR